MTNAKLVVIFPPKTVYEFPVTWTEDCISNSSDIAYKLYSGKEYDKDWDNKECISFPEIDIVLDSNPKIKSRCHFDTEAMNLFPTRSLESLKKG